MAEKQQYKLSEENETKQPVQKQAVPSESKAFNIIVNILEKKFLVIGIPVAAIIVAIILISINSAREKSRNEAALKFQTAKSMDELIAVHENYPGSSYGAYALERAAKIALDKGDYAKARELAQQFLKQYPQNNLAIYVKTYIPISLENEGKYDEAISGYKQILENDPQMDVVSDSLNLRIGFCYEMKQDFASAKSYYQKISSRSGLTGQPVEGVPSVWSSEASARIRKIEQKEKNVIKTVPK